MYPRFLIPVFFLLLSLVAPTWAQKEHLRVGIFPFAPMSFLDQDNQAQGLNPSLLKKIAEEQDWQLTFIEGSWAEGLERLAAGEIDLVMSAAYSEERARTMDYTTQPTLELWGQVFVREGESNINISDLDGKHVGIMRRDISGQNFIEAAGNLSVKAEYHNFENFSDVFTAVKNGEIFAGVAPQHFGLRYAKEFGLVPSSIQFSPYSIYFASKKGQQKAVLKTIDETLVRWKRDKESFYYRQLSHWLGETASNHILFPKWFKYSIFILGGVCLLLSPYTLLLAQRLKKEKAYLSLANNELLAIYHGAPGLMLVVDGDQRVCKANKAALEICLCSEKEMVGKRPGELFGCIRATAVECGTHPECENCLLRLTVLEAVDKGEAIRCKEATLMQNSDNGVLRRHLLVSVSPLNQAENSQTLICLEDITDVKNAQFALMESEERFRTLFDGAGDAIFLIDSSAQIIDVNQHACEVLGYSKSELLKMKVPEVDAIYEEADFVECLTAIENGEFPYIMDRSHRCKNGRIFDVEVSACPIILQNESFTLAIARDMTLRKKSERELIASERRYNALYNQFNALLNAISDPLILLASDMQTVWTNAAYKKLNSLSSKKESPLDTLDLEATVSRCFLTSKVVEDVIHTADKRMWGVKVFPLTESEEKETLALVIAADITEKIQLREEAHRASRLASLGELAAGIAHEINNPNAVILLNSAIIKDAFADAEDILNAHFKEHGDLSLAGIDYAEMRIELPLLIDRVQDSANRIKRIVNGLKNFVREEEGTSWELVDVNKVVTDGVRLLENVIKKSTNNFSMKLEAGLPVIRGDAQKLVQVLVNLVHNACQALTNTSQAIVVETCFDSETRNLILSVADQGHGIKKDQLPRLFEPFYTTKRNTGGTGLGLSVSHRILKEHGAKMTIESEPNQGSVFSVFIPVNQQEG